MYILVLLFLQQFNCFLQKVSYWIEPFLIHDSNKKHIIAHDVGKNTETYFYTQIEWEDDPITDSPVWKALTI